MSSETDKQVNIYYKLDEKLLQLIATSINDIITIQDLAGNCHYISPSVEKLLGYSPEEIVGTNILGYYHPDDRPRLLDNIGRAKAGLAPTTSCECRCCCKDGSVRWLESKASRIHDDRGNLTELLVISRDITARKQMEQELRNSFDRLALAIDGAKAGVWGFWPGSDRRVNYRRWWDILGYEKGEMSSTREGWLNLCHLDDRRLVEKEVNEFLAGRRDRIELQHRLRHKNGSYRWVIVNAKPVKDGDGKEPRSIGLITDITDLKRLEAAKRESERRLRDFAQALPDISMIVDENGQYVEVFGQDEKLLPRPREELRGRTLYQGLLAKHADLLVSKLRQTIKTRKPQTLDLEVMVRNGRHFVEIRMAPMKYLADGKKTVAVVFTDVSEKRRAGKLVEFAFNLRRRSSFIEDVMQGKSLNARTVAEAHALGLDLSMPLFCSIVHLEDAGGGSATAENFARRQNRIIELLCDESQLFVWNCHGYIGIIHRAESEESDPAKDIQAASRILEIIAACDPHLKVAIGVGGRSSGPEGIRRSYRQAANAAVVADSQEGREKVCHYHDIGINKFLAGFSGEEQAKEYVQETLGKLLEYDRQKGTDLLHTLEEILENASLKAAARKLFLHYNTVVLHKVRIEKILGASIEDVETRLALAAALKLYKLEQKHYIN